MILGERRYLVLVVSDDLLRYLQCRVLDLLNLRLYLHPVLIAEQAQGEVGVLPSHVHLDHGVLQGVQVEGGPRRPGQVAHPPLLLALLQLRVDGGAPHAGDDVGEVVLGGGRGYGVRVPVEALPEGAVGRGLDGDEDGLQPHGVGGERVASELVVSRLDLPLLGVVDVGGGALEEPYYLPHELLVCQPSLQVRLVARLGDYLLYPSGDHPIHQV